MDVDWINTNTTNDMDAHDLSCGSGDHLTHSPHTKVFKGERMSVCVCVLRDILLT